MRPQRCPRPEKWFSQSRWKLEKEVDFLIAQANSEQNLSEAYDLGWSLGTLVTFWQVIAHISRTGKQSMLTVDNAGS